MTDAKTLHFGVFEVTAPQVGGTFSCVMSQDIGDDSVSGHR